mgnify:CR=1 FL=1
MSFRGQALTITRRDLNRERRSGEVLWVTLPFGAVALFLMPIAIGNDIPGLADIGVGLFWLVVMLFGVLIAIRQTSAETEAQRDMVTMTGIDPAAVFVGKAAASFLLILLFELVLGALTIVLYDVELVGLAFIPVVFVLAGAGLSLLGTIAAGIVSSGRNAAALVPLLVAPLSVPLLIGATQSYEALSLGRSSLSWVLMMAITVLVLAVAGVLSAQPLQESG